MDYKKQIQENALASFRHYVSAWKKQNPNTVKVDGDIYEYTTKKGIIKRFRLTDKRTNLRVNGFNFEEIKE